MIDYERRLGQSILIEGAQVHSKRTETAAIIREDSPSRSRRLNRRAQFMVVTIVLIGIAFFSMYLLVRTVDRNSAMMFEQPDTTNFENLHDAVIQRNAWIQSYWWNLNWENRAVVNVTSADTLGDALMVNPNIQSGIDCRKEIRVIDSAGAELKSNANSEQSPCSVVFIAPSKTGAYYIYWNNPAATEPSYRAEVAAAGEVPSAYTISAETSPAPKFCPHAEDIVPASAGGKLDCSIQNLIGNNKINYAIDYQTLGFSFSGYLS